MLACSTKRRLSYPHSLHPLLWRYQLQQIWKQNKVQSTFLYLKWLWLVNQISQGLHGFCQLSIASRVRERQLGGKRGGGREGGREGGTVQSNQPMMLFVLSADRRRPGEPPASDGKFNPTHPVPEPRIRTIPSGRAGEGASKVHRQEGGLKKLFTCTALRFRRPLLLPTQCGCQRCRSLRAARC